MESKIGKVTAVIIFIVLLPIVVVVKYKYNTMPLERTLNTVVHITNETRGWQGSGVAISKDIVLTAKHVLENGVNFTVTLNDGTEVKAYKAISHNDYDVGFLRVEKPMLSPAKLGSSERLNLGQELYVIGSPYGKINFNSVTFGIVSGLDRSYKGYGIDKYGWSIAFTTDAAGHPGNSGCPVFTKDGVVRGILVGGFSPVLCIVMPVELILDDIEEIKLLFIQLDYYVEKEPEYNYSEYYNYEEDNEYYICQKNYMKN